jgi:hypothetical protein
MSKRKMIAGSLLTLVMVLSCMMFGMTSVAFADTEYYDYTVRVFGGEQGDVVGETPAVYKADSDGNYGSWDPDKYSVTMKNDKYYFKNWHIAGQEKVATGFPVTEDVDVVASYGVKGDDIVAYTVTFTDASGAELRASQTYYGKINEKPVVSYLYIDGYTPQALALTKTLVADESQNVFPFVYTEGSVDNGGSTTGGEGAAAGGTTAGGAAAGTTGGTAGAAGAGDAGAAGGAGADGAAAIDDDAAPQTQPADVVDLDDDETPLAPGDADEQDGEKKGGLGMGLYLGIGIGIAAIIAAIAALLRRRGNDEAAGE